MKIKLDKKMNEDEITKNNNFVNHLQLKKNNNPKNEDIFES
jgi:hypothetical protein